jgi:ParB-like chromosome segregation protein Spo0J
MIKLSKIKLNPNNPRLIKDERFEKLCKSIQEFPKMLELRPIIIDNDNIVLGGNMRFKALIHLGLKEVPENYFKNANDLTEEETRRFIIADNVGFGEHDFDILANEWDATELEDWGLNIPNFQSVDYSGKNKEIDTDIFENEMIIKLKYSENDYNLVKEALSKFSGTPEQSVWQLLKL